MANNPQILPPIDDVEEPPEQSARILPLLPPLAIVAAPRPLDIPARIEDDAASKGKLGRQGNLSSDTTASNFTVSSDAHGLPAYINPVDVGGIPRKRQKLDLFQLLPKPTVASLQTNVNAPLLPTIPLLSGLRQPPPTAARFPPITPEKPRDDAVDLRLPPTHPVSSIENVPGSRSTNLKTLKAKRQKMRARRAWTERETRYLLKGVEIYGVGKWKSILKSSDLHFHSERSAVDLKDRYRTCQLGNARSKNKKQGSITQTVNGKRGPVKIDIPTLPTNLDTRKSGQMDFEVSTVTDLKEQLRQPRRTGASKDNPQRFVRWTLEEDAALLLAHRKYGFKWTLMAQDLEVDLMHRTAGQIRDRFRVKYPKNYESNTPLSVAKQADAIKTASSLAVNADDVSKSRPKGNLDWLLQDDPLEDINASFARLSKDFSTGAPKANPTEALPSSRINQTIVTATSVPGLHTSTKESAISAIDMDNDMLAANELSTTMETVIDADETRNPNIAELLNDDLEPLSQLPPLKFPFDQDWSGDAYDDSLTLAPLVWGSYDFTTGQWIGGMNG